MKKVITLACSVAALTLNAMNPEERTPLERALAIADAMCKEENFANYVQGKLSLQDLYDRCVTYVDFEELNGSGKTQTCRIDEILELVCNFECTELLQLFIEKNKYWFDLEPLKIINLEVIDSQSKKTASNIRTAMYRLAQMAINTDKEKILAFLLDDATPETADLKLLTLLDRNMIFEGEAMYSSLLAYSIMENKENAFKFLTKYKLDIFTGLLPEGIKIPRPQISIPLMIAWLQQPNLLYDVIKWMKTSVKNEIWLTNKLAVDAVKTAFQNKKISVMGEKKFLECLTNKDKMNVLKENLDEAFRNMPVGLVSIPALLINSKLEKIFLDHPELIDLFTREELLFGVMLKNAKPLFSLDPYLFSPYASSLIRKIPFDLELSDIKDVLGELFGDTAHGKTTFEFINLLMKKGCLDINDPEVSKSISTTFNTFFYLDNLTIKDKGKKNNPPKKEESDAFQEQMRLMAVHDSCIPSSSNIWKAPISTINFLLSKGFVLKNEDRTMLFFTSTSKLLNGFIDKYYVQGIEQLLSRANDLSSLLIIYPLNRGYSLLDKVLMMQFHMNNSKLFLDQEIEKLQSFYNKNADLSDEKIPLSSELLQALESKASPAEFQQILGKLLQDIYEKFVEHIKTGFETRTPLADALIRDIAAGYPKNIPQIKAMLSAGYSVNPYQKYTLFQSELNQINAFKQLEEMEIAEADAKQKQKKTKKINAQKEEAARKAKEAAELKAKQEAELNAIEEEKKAAERAAKREAARIKEEKKAIRKAKEDAKRKAIEEKKAAELAAKQEAELKAKQEAELKAKQEAELKAKQEAELKAKQEAELKAKQEAELKAKQEAELKAKQEAELKAKQEAELKAKQEAELKAKQEAELKAKQEAELKAKQEAELKAKQEAELKAKQEAELKAKQKADQEKTLSLTTTSTTIFDENLVAIDPNLIQVREDSKVTTPLAQTVLQREIQQADRETIKQLESQNNDLREQLSTIQKRINQIESSIGNGSAIEKLQLQNDDLKKKLSANESTMASLQEEVDELQSSTGLKLEAQESLSKSPTTLTQEEKDKIKKLSSISKRLFRDEMNKQFPDFNVVAPNGWTFLHYFCTIDLTESTRGIFNTLCSFYKNTQDLTGWTPLFLAVKYQKLEQVQILLGHGSDIQKKDFSEYHNTILHVCALYGNSEIMSELINAGADINAMTEKLEKTPIELLRFYMSQPDKYVAKANIKARNIEEDKKMESLLLGRNN